MKTSHDSTTFVAILTVPGVSCTIGGETNDAKSASHAPKPNHEVKQLLLRTHPVIISFPALTLSPYIMCLHCLQWLQIMFRACLDSGVPGPERGAGSKDSYGFQEKGSAKR